MSDWPHQTYAVDELTRRIDGPQFRTCVTSPTGGGKSRIMHRVIEAAHLRNKSVALLADRKLLLDQLSDGLMTAGIQHRTVRAGHEDNGRRDVILASVQTLIARSQQPVADIVLIDEAHNNKATKRAELLNGYHDSDASLIGVTATPLEVSHLYDELIVAGTTSELRKCGALVPARVYSCGEMDTSKIKRTATGEYSYNDIKRHVWRQAIVGQVIEQYNRSGCGRPAIGFAPGVAESKYLTEECDRLGVKSAHIDGEAVYVDGVETAKNRDRVEEVFGRHRSGDIKIVWNRFVMREGIDLPYVSHLILATPVGSILSYIQMVGRVLRNHDSLPVDEDGRRYVTIQDHGGNWWRHPSPNADLDDLWRRYWHCPAKMITDDRLEAFKSGEFDNSDPVTKEIAIECPQCHAIQAHLIGGCCYSCGLNLRGKPRVRSVIQRDGELAWVNQAPVRKRRVVDDRELWEQGWQRAYYSHKRKGRSFAQARAWLISGQMRGFERLAGAQPPMDLPLMPKNRSDWNRSVADVPHSELY